MRKTRCFKALWTVAALVLGVQATALAQDKTFVIGFPQDNMSNDWRRAQVMEVKEALAAYPNVQFIYTDAQGDTAKNIQDIEDLIDRGIDLLMVGPRDARAMTPVIEDVYAKGIPVVLLTRDILSNAYTAFVSPSDARIAASAAHFIALKLSGKGKVLMLQGVPTATTAIKRTDGFLEDLKEHPDVQVVAIKPANYLRSEAIKAVEQALEEGLEFDAIYAQSDSMAAGARLALQAAGIDPKSKLIVGIDYIPEARDAIRAGEQAATFTYPTAGKEAARIAMDILAGKTVPKRSEVQSQMITIENVDDIAPVFE